MTEIEKIQLLDDQLRLVREKVALAISKSPDEWAGMEVKWLIHDAVNAHTPPKYGERFDNFMNEVIVNNII
jgi:hypothetical protein